MAIGGDAVGEHLGEESKARVGEVLASPYQAVVDEGGGGAPGNGNAGVGEWGR